MCPVPNQRWMRMPLWAAFAPTNTPAWSTQPICSRQCKLLQREMPLTILCIGSAWAPTTWVVWPLRLCMTIPWMQATILTVSFISAQWVVVFTRRITMVLPGIRWAIWIWWLAAWCRMPMVSFMSVLVMAIMLSATTASTNNPMITASWALVFIPSMPDTMMQSTKWLPQQLRIGSISTTLPLLAICCWQLPAKAWDTPPTKVLIGLWLSKVVPTKWKSLAIIRLLLLLKERFILVRMSTTWFAILPMQTPFKVIPSSPRLLVCSTSPLLLQMKISFMLQALAPMAFTLVFSFPKTKVWPGIRLCPMCNPLRGTISMLVMVSLTMAWLLTPTTMKLFTF